jgi:hypothetical protein
MSISVSSDECGERVFDPVGTLSPSDSASNDSGEK